MGEGLKRAVAAARATRRFAMTAKRGKPKFLVRDDHIHLRLCAKCGHLHCDKCGPCFACAREQGPRRKG